jgi:type VI secretion system protein ImpM
MDVGIYGKLPSHGDFLRRRVPDDFIGVWDAWLQECVAASRSALGEQWLDLFLTSPAWRFALDAGVCGAHACAGMLLPSVDRVGRYFPLTLMWQAPEHVTPFKIARKAQRWFDLAERLVIETLATERIDLDEFDRQLIALNAELRGIDWQDAVELDTGAAEAVTAGGRLVWQIPLGAQPAFGELAEQLLYARLRAAPAPLTFFWTEGSAVVESSSLLTSGLPAPANFSALLNGKWLAHGWRTVPATVVEAPMHAETMARESLLQFRSAVLSDVGKVRAVNQDAFIERPEIGLWAVADGMGGHSQGEVASRMVCDALAALVPQPTLETMVDAIVHALEGVNEYLHRAATRAVNPIQSGSTAVVLTVRGTRCAVLWAGDSRLYRLRGMRLEQLTRDHVSHEGEPPDEMPNAISRAVGGDRALVLDIVFHDVSEGDTFLLCSDGLTRELTDERIHELLAAGNAEARARCLLDAALNAGGRDNVTVMVVEAVT